MVWLSLTNQSGAICRPATLIGQFQPAAAQLVNFNEVTFNAHAREQSASWDCPVYVFYVHDPVPHLPFEMVVFFFVFACTEYSWISLDMSKMTTTVELFSA